MFWVLIITIPVSLLIGIISGMREGSKTDRALSVFSIITTSNRGFCLFIPIIVYLQIDSFLLDDNDIESEEENLTRTSNSSPIHGLSQ